MKMKINKSRLVEIIKEEMALLLEAATPGEISGLELQRDAQLRKLQAQQAAASGETEGIGAEEQQQDLTQITQRIAAIENVLRKMVELKEYIDQVPKLTARVHALEQAAKQALEGPAEWKAPSTAGGPADPTKGPMSGGTPTMTKTSGGPFGKAGPSARRPRSTKSRSPMGKGAPTTPSRGYTK